MNEEYNRTVMDHFLNPRNAGSLPDADAVGTIKNPSCGDVVRLFLKIEDNRIVRAKAKTFGCAAAIASASILTELVAGKTLNEASGITNSSVVTALGGLPEHKVRCSVLAEEVIHASLADYRSRVAPRSTL